MRSGARLGELRGGRSVEVQTHSAMFVAGLPVWLL